MKNMTAFRNRPISGNVATFSFRSTDPVLFGVCAEGRAWRVVTAR
jgi:hypothetical protein